MKRKKLILGVIYTFVIISCTIFGTNKINNLKIKKIVDKAYKNGKEAGKADVIFMVNLNGDKTLDVIVQLKNGYRYPFTCSLKGKTLVCQRPVEIDAKDLEKKINKK